MTSTGNITILQSSHNSQLFVNRNQSASGGGLIFIVSTEGEKCREDKKHGMSSCDYILTSCFVLQQPRFNVN